MNPIISEFNECSSHTLIHGSCPPAMNEIPDESIHVCVTSPPYWAMRKYSDTEPVDFGDGWTEHLGQESDADIYVTHLVQIFKEVNRVLRDDGLLFLNIGDTHKKGSLDGIPWKVAERMKPGWFLRQEIQWCKKSPMPQSMSGSCWEKCCGNCEKCIPYNGYKYSLNAGRPTTAHEVVFMFSKSENYFYNQESNRVASKEPPASGGVSSSGYDKEKHKGRTEALARPPATTQDREYNPRGRNLWSYWTDISHRGGFKGKHFATMPIDLAVRLIRLGTSEAGCCPECGDQFAPVVSKRRRATRSGDQNKRKDAGKEAGNVDHKRHVTDTLVEAWWPTCKCDAAADEAPCRVLDPFAGVCTTGLAAKALGHVFTGVEPSEEYLLLGIDRMNKPFSRPKIAPIKQHGSLPGQLSLFP